MGDDGLRLHLVRHGRPRVDAAVPASEWQLDPDAVSEVQALRGAGVLPLNGWWVSSPEPKAAATAHLLTAMPVRIDDGLREAMRGPDLVSADEFHRRVLRSFAVPDEPGTDQWESLAATQVRVTAAAERAVAEASGRDIVLVGHGTSLTLLVAALTGKPPDVAAWRTMRMPDHCALRGDPRQDPTYNRPDAADRRRLPRWPWARVVSGWGSWAP